MRHAPLSQCLSVLFVCLVSCGLLGCDGNRDRSSDGLSAKPGESDGPTIVSLTPAITRMLIDMGKRDQIIGVSQDDDASLDLPLCGSFNKPDIPRIVQLKPDLVLTESSMGSSGDVPGLLQKLADKELIELKVISHSQSIADVQRTLIDAEDGLGAAVGDPDAAERARELMALRIELVAAVLKDVDRPRVLMLINPRDLGAIGTGVTHDELLRLSGGTNALAHVKSGYLRLDRAKLQQTIRPDVVLILEPGGSELADGDPRLRPFDGLSIPVVTSRRFAVIQHPHALLPSTALPEVMLEIALVLHPDKAAEIREAYDTAELIVQQTQADGDDL